MSYPVIVQEELGQCWKWFQSIIPAFWITFWYFHRLRDSFCWSWLRDKYVHQRHKHIKAWQGREGFAYKTLERAGAWDTVGINVYSWRAGQKCVCLSFSVSIVFGRPLTVLGNVGIGALIQVCCPWHLLCQLSVSTPFQSLEGSGNWIFCAGLPTTMLRVSVSSLPREKSTRTEQAESVTLIKDQTLKWLHKLIIREHWIYRSPL